MHLLGWTEENFKETSGYSAPLPRFESKASWIQVRTSSLVSLCKKIIMCSSVNELGAIALLREELHKLPRGCVQWGGTDFLRRTAAALSPPDRPPRCWLIQAEGRCTWAEASSVLAGIVPWSLQLQAQVTLVSLDWCHKSGECTKSCSRRSLCFCSRSSGGASVRLLT
jgi:hypothetical protein